MIILANILNVIWSFNEVFWLYQWVNIFFQRRDFLSEIQKKRVVGILYVLGGVIICGMNQIALISAYTMVAIMVFNIVAVLIFWKSDIMQVLAVVGGYFFLLFAIGNVEIALTGVIGGEALIKATTTEQGMARVIYILLGGLIWLGLNWLAVSQMRKRPIEKQSIKYLAYISVVGFIGCAFIGTIMLQSFNLHIHLMWNVFAIILLIIFWIMHFTIRLKDARLRMAVLEAKNGMLERNYLQANEFYTTNAKLYHDMKHHLNAIYSMLQVEKQQDAMRYIESLQILNSDADMKVYSGINILDAVLYETDLQAQKKGIDFKIESPLLPNDMGIENRDICSLFANLLENALEASSKEIRLEIKRVNQVLIVTVQNDYIVEPVRLRERFITQKKEKKLHGWGMQIIEQIVEKYEGDMECQIENGYFKTSIILYERMK